MIKEVYIDPPTHLIHHIMFFNMFNENGGQSDQTLQRSCQHRGKLNEEYLMGSSNVFNTAILLGTNLVGV